MLGKWNYSCFILLLFCATSILFTLFRGSVILDLYFVYKTIVCSIKFTPLFDLRPFHLRTDHWLFCAVIHEPEGPTESSQYEHSSIPATVKKLFNLESNFLTKRDAWAGTFENYFYIRDTPRDDCPGLHHSPWSLQISFILLVIYLISHSHCIFLK